MPPFFGDEATGGDIKEEADFKAFDVKPLLPLPEAKQPGEDVMSIIRAPKLDTVQYGDEGPEI